MISPYTRNPMASYVDNLKASTCHTNPLKDFEKALLSNYDSISEFVRFPSCSVILRCSESLTHSNIFHKRERTDGLCFIADIPLRQLITIWP